MKRNDGRLRIGGGGVVWYGVLWRLVAKDNPAVNDESKTAGKSGIGTVGESGIGAVSKSEIGIAGE